MRTVLAGLICIACAAAPGSDLDEFKIKRSGPFEFAAKPQVTRDGDRVVIRFAARAACDVTVTLENSDGDVVRHLASGVLGPTAPKPFETNSLEQTVVWDGKDDGGEYVDEADALTVRVSLGLKPRFERTLFWSPRRRQSRLPQAVCAAEEGVYVYDGGVGMDHLRLFDHEGHYVRTVYPFPSDRIEEAEGLAWHTFPQDGKRLPLKTNFLQCTMLTSGTNAWNIQTYDREKKRFRSVVGAGGNAHFGMYGAAATAMAVRDGRIALAHVQLNRLGTDGTTGGLPLQGPKTAISAPTRRGRDNPTALAVPRSAALSPDGKWLYLTGYIYGRRGSASQDIQYTRDWRCVPAVMRLNVETGEEMEVFKGRANPNKAKKGDPFKVPTSVDVDAKGRVYVTDQVLDRLFIYSRTGKLLKTIQVDGPAAVSVHPKTGEIYVFSWKVMNEFEKEGVKSALRCFGTFDEAKEKAAWPLGKGGGWNFRYRTTGMRYFAELDGWTDPPTVWLTTEGILSNVLTRRGGLNYGNLVLLRPKDGTLQTVRQFAHDVERAGVPQVMHRTQRQRLYVNPTNGKVYLAEGDQAVGKSFDHVHEIDPETGRVRVVRLPFHAEDMCFDLDGLAYLRTINVVARYNPKTWREVPWDYGEERSKVAYGWSSGTRRAHVVAGLMMPSDGNWHHGGMHVSADKKLIVGCLLGFSTQVRTSARYVHRGDTYNPMVYPGRLLGGRGGATCVHVWDRHGKVVHEDAVPGLADLYGVAIDPDDGIYVMTAATRILDGERYYNDMTGTLMKVRPNQSRVLTSSGKVPVPLSETNYPDRPRDVTSSMQGSAWVQEPEWLYGGVGFGGKNRGVGCACWNFRFAHDYLGRSFAPEMDRYRVAVLDSAGNLITRIGHYGNVEDGEPLVEKGGPPTTRSVGGDEVALFHAPYLATHTDRRLFIADPGNLRVLSVRLGYHATETVDLKDVPERE
ncbi:MAG: hypothetical protein R6V58_08535 [Planctomycetota bacterium]